MGRKSMEQMQAEQIVATLLRHNSLEKTLAIVKNMENQWKYAIAQRTTVAIMLVTLWDFWTEFNETELKEFYDSYLAYHKSFNEGKEDIYKQMKAIDDLLDGDLMKEDLFDAIKERAENE